MGNPKKGRNAKQRIPLTDKRGKIGPPQNPNEKKIPIIKPVDLDKAKPFPDSSGILTLNDYQNACLAFVKFPDKFTITYPVLGLVSEAGECAGVVKKVIRDHKDLDMANLPNMVKPELGDVLWYVAVLANNLGLTLEDVAKYNIDKLTGRFERGTIGGSGDDR